MEQISKTLNSNSYRKLNNISSIAIEPLTRLQEDELLSAYSDVIDPNYKLWFIVKLREVGKQQFVEAGEKARKYGTNPNKLFSYLLR